MTPAEFCVVATGYYGEYKPVVRDEVARWLAEKPGDYIRAMWEEVKHGYSNRFRQPPDVATLVEHERAAWHRYYEGKPQLLLEDPVANMTFEERQEMRRKMVDMFRDLAERKRVGSELP